MSDDTSTDVKIVGHILKLDKHRSVFVGGRADDDSASIYIEFRNRDAVERFCISTEAASALAQMLAFPNPALGESKTYRVARKPTQREWQLVSNLAEDA
jgi:hypothetical protein